jgi:hypothetical protein
VLGLREGWLHAYATPGLASANGDAWHWHQNEWNTGHYGDDTRPPMKPANLHATGPTTICWTAPGNDWNVGTAASYDLRSFSQPPTPENFASGTPLSGAPTPTAAGSEQCATVATNAPYVGLRAIDAAGNISYPAALANTPPATVTTEPASSVTASQATLHASVNPNGSQVSDCHFEYGTTTAYGQSAPCTPSPGSGESPVAVSASIGGLSAGMTYHFRISATNAAGASTGEDETFTTGSQTPPTVITEAATAVAQTSATANASVNPNGAEVSDCHFDYGTTTAYGQSAPCTPSPGSGQSPVAVSAALEGLSENTTYHFRVSATSAAGTSTGEDQSFSTALVLGPHWYKNGVFEEGTPGPLGLPVMAWGTLTLSNTSIGALRCQTIAAGGVENPTGGGAGKGALAAFFAYNCSTPPCEAAGGRLEVVPEKLGWSSVLVEQQGLFRDKLEGIALRVHCAANGTDIQFHGSLAPQVINGTSIGASPSKLEFGPGSGSLQSTAGAGEVAGRLKLMGYEAQDLIQAKNP